MKPFNLEKALAGAPVITREGTEVIRLFTVPEANPEHRLFVVFDDGRVITLYENGKYHEAKNHYLDLFMAPTKKEGWINIYNAHSISATGSNIYPTEEAALANKGFDCIATIKIEWEE